MKMINENKSQPALEAAKKEADIKNQLPDEVIIIYDECGDTLWDAVLEQEYPALKYPDIIF